MTKDDINQCNALREQYRHLLHKKDKYIEDVLKSELTYRQYLHLDVGFRLLTLEIKSVEAKLHAIMFGGELIEELPPIPLRTYLDKHIHATYEEKIKELDRQLYKANKIIKSLRAKHLLKDKNLSQLRIKYRQDLKRV